MKKVLLIISLCLLTISIVLLVRDNMIKNDNKHLKNEIEKVTTEKNNIENDNQKYENDINNLKEEKKDKWEELEIWKNYQEKITKALS